MNFFWFNQWIIENYLQVKRKNPELTPYDLGNAQHKKLHLINRCFSSAPWGLCHDSTNHVPHVLNIETKTNYRFVSESRSFAEICLDTAEKISKMSSRNIAVFWSGGIDSTAALTSLLQTIDVSRLTVACNSASIAEFPSFYEHKIKNRVKTVSPSYIYKNFQDYLTVTGDGGDTIWGCFDESFWNKNHQKLLLPWQDCIDRAIIDDFDFIEEFCSWSGTKISTWSDLHTWFYLCCKHQDKCMRPYSLKQDYTSDDIVAFFDVDASFQHWTMNNLDKILGKQWQDYKIPAKEYIYQYHPDHDYLNNKTKVESPGLTPELQTKNTYLNYNRLAVPTDFSYYALPSWPFIDFAELEDFNDQFGLIPMHLLVNN